METLAKNFVALSRRRKKKGSARSQMLRMIMPMLSQENGEKLSRAIQKKDINAARRVMDKIKQQLAEKLAVEASSVQDVFDDLDESLVAECASHRDLTSLIKGNEKIPRLTRELVANGSIKLDNDPRQSNTLTIFNVRVNNRASSAVRPIMTIKAQLHTSNGEKGGTTVSAQGEYAAACSELVVSALSIMSEVNEN